jgi:hypothetical protein
VLAGTCTVIFSMAKLAEMNATKWERVDNNLPPMSAD